MRMTKDQFFAQFIPQFLAAHVAVNYDDISMRIGWSKYKPPTEDAVSLAETNWEALKETNPEVIDQ